MNNLKEIRELYGSTQEAVASAINVNRVTVANWENGNSNPDIELLAPIARLLNISLDTLLSFHDKLTGAEIEEILDIISNGVDEILNTPV